MEFNIKNNDIATKNSGVDYSSGGGSIIYYRNDINTKIVKDFSEHVPDSLAIELDSNVGQFCIACIYRSLNLTTPINNILLSSIKDIYKTSYTFERVVVGDFNLPDVSWDTGNVKCPQVTQNELSLQQMQYV